MLKLLPLRGSNMKYEFSYYRRVIPYDIIIKDVKNINIRVKPSGEVVISCNSNIDTKTIELQLMKRARWLISSIDKYKTNYIEFEKTNHTFLDGEAFLLLGRVLRIKNIDSDEFKVDFDNNYLYIYRKFNQGVKLKFNKWYKEFILKSFNNQLDLVFEKFKKYNIQKPKIIYKNMKTQWGSCNIEKRVITLNTQLAKVDEFLTEYVICHELTHLLFKYHDNNFYSFLTSLIPDWKQREKILNNIFITNVGGK